jgi:hypothetical protein
MSFVMVRKKCWKLTVINSRSELSQSACSRKSQQSHHKKAGSEKIKPTTDDDARRTITTLSRYVRLPLRYLQYLCSLEHAVVDAADSHTALFLHPSHLSHYIIARSCTAAVDRINPSAY